MKSNFALSLSFEGIRLLHRAAGGWRLVGDVSLESTDMAGELALLRANAKLLEPGGIRTKLLLPDAQIKYLTIETVGLSDAERLERARAALDGATPYAVDDLAFDICADGDQTHIAAVATETLAEAEGFATEYAFNPISFTAVPGEQPYLGAPFFGETEGAAALLQGEPLEHDDIAVVIIGNATIPSPEPETAQSVEASQSEADELEKTPNAEPPLNEAILPATSPEPVQPTPAKEPTLMAPEPPKAPPAPPVVEELVKAPVDKPDAKAPLAETVAVAVAPQVTAKPDVKAPAKKAPAPQIQTPSAPPPAPKITAKNAVADDSVPPPLPQIAAELSQSKDAPSAGFASRRAAKPEDAAKRAEPTLGAANPNSAQQSAAPTLTASYADVVIEPSAPDAAPVPLPAKKPGRFGFLSKRLAAKTVAPVPKSPKAAKEPRRTAKAGASEAERMTIFGARSGNVGGKPKFLGLMLTAALLVFLAGVAAWASVFLDDGINLSRFFGERSKPEFSTAQDPPKAVAEPEQETVITASLDTGLTAEDSAVLDALRAPVLPPDDTLSQAELEAKYAATGIWSRAPVGPPEPTDILDIDDLYLTSIDPISTASDAIALPAVTGYATDAALPVFASPTAAGTQFALDARGLVIPTVQGTLSPEGIVVYLGTPAVTPPAQLARFQTEPENTTALSTLAELRPQVRPGGLTENYERAQLDGLTRSELASLRPALRPSSLQERVAALAVPEPVETDAAVAAALASTAAPAIENATKQAVRASVRPDTRPRNFARIVRRAERAAPAAETVKVASAATVAPRVVKPSIPSSASVARSATVKNAINLRKVNLIGVYGKPSSRRALVRLGNGRYRKVTVGDRIDGGRVSAIGQGELRYTKGGRNVVLKMPKG
jgi:DNA-binding transcriptional regulator YdaS (Cro superfamily)